MVIIAGGVLLIIMGLFGKIGAIFTTIPTPVVGGMFLVMFGVISAAGVSNLQVNSCGDSHQFGQLPRFIYLLLLYNGHKTFCM